MNDLDPAPAFRRMLSRRGWVAAGAVLLGLTAVAVAVLVAARSSSPSKVAFTHADYVRSFADARIGKMAIGSLKSWPAPYQSYTDQYRQRCFEWWDKGHALYNLCFKHGLLALKAIE